MCGCVYLSSQLLGGREKQAEFEASVIYTASSSQSYIMTAGPKTKQKQKPLRASSTGVDVAGVT